MNARATRRQLFGAPALLLLGASEAGPAKAAELDGELLAACALGPDATLIELCGAALAIENESDRLWDIAVALADAKEIPHDHPAWLAYSDHEQASYSFVDGAPGWHTLVSAIAITPARTQAGLRAKADVARRAVPSARRESPDPCDALAWSVLDDLAGRAAA